MEKRLQIRASGFTLIELLIVVAIIAILAAIAVPNFLEAQTRAKVSRIRADQRTIATGLEVYRIDTNTYPHTNYDNRALTDRKGSGYELTLERLTTPVAYMTGDASFYDVFKPRNYYLGADLEQVRVLRNDGHGDNRTNQSFWYTARSNTSMLTWNALGKTPTWWFLESSGPDGHLHLTGNLINSMTTVKATDKAVLGKLFYDATNGTVSRGSLWRAGGISPTWGKSFYQMASSI